VVIALRAPRAPKKANPPANDQIEETARSPQSPIETELAMFTRRFLGLPASLQSGTHRKHRHAAKAKQRPLLAVETLENRVLLTADLRVVAASAPLQADIGNGPSATVSWTVENTGSSAVDGAFWWDSIYFSEDKQFDPGDLLLNYTGIEDQANLAPGGDYSRELTVAIPNYVGEGNRYLLVVTDDGDAFGDGGYLDESNEANNVGPLAIELVSPDVDLKLTDVRMPEILVPGETITVHWTLTNHGSVAAQAPRNDHFYISEDDNLFFEDSLLAELRIENSVIEPGQSRTYSVDFAIPAGTALGDYFFFVEADHWFEQADTTFGDMVAMIPVVVAANGPDLAIAAADSPLEADITDTIEVSWTVENVGGAIAIDFSADNVYLSTDDVWDSADQLVGEFFVDDEAPLAPGGTYTRSVDVSLSSGTADHQFILIVADGARQQRETDEANNVVARPITITQSGADLIVTHATAPTSADIGASLSVNWTVKNQGDDATDASFWFDSVVLSNDEFLDTGDVTLSSELTFAVIDPQASRPRSTFITIPSTLGAGPKYLLFITDSSNQQVETDDGNNFLARPILLTQQDVNLQVSSVTAPASVLLQNQFSLSYTVANVGTNVANADWIDRVYLSADPVIGGASDVFVHSENVAAQSPLAGGGSYSITRNVSIANNVPSGDYYLLVFADASLSQLETNNNDNVRAIPIRVDSPDLVISNLVVPAAAVVGQTIQISWDVTNTGTTAAAATWIDRASFSTSSGAPGSQGVTNYNTTPHRPLAPGATYHATMNVVVPNFVGNRFLTIETDPGDGQGEASSSNNLLSLPIQIAAPTVDLVITSFTATSTGYPGSTVNASWTVTNQGTTPASVSRWFDVLNLAENAAGTQNPVLLAVEDLQNVQPLAPGASYTINRSFPIPSTYTGSGNRFIVLDVDQTDLQSETNNGNNRASSAISIGLPDLQVTAASGPASAAVGAVVPVSWTVTNAGAATAGADWDDFVYFSTNTTLDAGDLAFAFPSAAAFSPLAPGASYTFNLDLLVPAATPGNYFFLVKTDAASEQPETNENNNVRAIPITISSADLVVESVSVPITSGNLGDTIDVTFMVRNIGNAPSTQTWHDGIFLVGATGETLLAERLATPNLPVTAGGSYQVTIPVTLPINVNSVAGTYTIEVRADHRFGQLESNELNNRRATSAIQLAIPPLPNLVVTNIAAPVQGFQSQGFTLNWTVQNSGAIPAVGTWVDRVYISVDNTFHPQQDTLAGEFSFAGAIGVGASIERSQPIVLPEQIGDYFIFVVTDAGGTIVEGPADADNVAVDDATIQVVASPRPDLVVTQITPPVAASTGQPVTISFEVTNIGNAPTQVPVWGDAVWLSQSPNDVLGPGLLAVIENLPWVQEFKFGFTWVPFFANPILLGPGESYTQTVELPTLEDRPGPWYVYVMTDAGGSPTFDGRNHAGVIWESNGANNLSVSAAFNLNLTPPPDLRVTDVAAPGQAFSGQPTNLSWTVTNDGPGGTPESSWTDAVYISADNVLDAGDTLLGTFARSGALASGQSYVANHSVTLPVGISGDYHLLVQTDRTDAVFEHAFENNNVGSDAVATAVLLTPPPDLEVVQVDAPATAQAGHTISLTYQVANLGATPAPNSTWTDAFYLSTDSQLDVGTDIRLATKSIFGPLADGASYTNTVQLTLPNGISGSYYVLVKSDDVASVFEVDRLNNVGFDATPVQVVSLPPDLRVVASAISTATGVAGQPLVVDWTVSNTGVGRTTSGTWRDKIYLSSDALPGGDLLLAKFDHAGVLDAAQTYSRSELVTIPLHVAAGSYFLYVLTDAPLTATEDGVAAPTGPAGNVFEAGADANNNSTPIAIAVVRETADLRIAALVPPVSAAIGQTVTLQYAVENIGPVPTVANWWYDDIYLSPNAALGDGNDVYIGSYFRAANLAAGGRYDVSLDLLVPGNLALGNYHFVVRTDRPAPRSGQFDSFINRVLEQPSEANNNGVSAAVPIVRPAAPDLEVTNVNAPAHGVSGRKFELTWTVRNAGQAAAFSSWSDAVYLSQDQVFDPHFDTYLGAVTHVGGLAPSASYTETWDFQIPAGFAGPRYVFVRSDAASAVYEVNLESNNLGYDSQAMAIALAAPVDLVAGTISLPANAKPGGQIHLEYVVSNAGPNDALGDWEDSLWLSTDPVWNSADVLLGTVAQTGGVVAGGSYVGQLTTTLPGVAPGDYYVIVRSDIRNRIIETNEANNIVASLNEVTLDVPALALGIPTNANLTTGQSQYFKIDVPAGETLRFVLDTLSAAAATELYVSYERVPNRTDADFRFDVPFSSDHRIIVPITRAGTYYVYVYGDQVPGGSTSFSLLAETIDFSVTSARPSAAGNAGSTTFDIRGAKFDARTSFRLIAPNGASVASVATHLIDSSRAFVTFDLAGRAEGTYDIAADSGLGTAVLENAVSVQTLPAGRLDTQLIVPALSFVNRYDVFSLSYSNRGNADLTAALYLLTSPTGTPFGLTKDALVEGDAVQVLGISGEGPAGVLSPGAAHSIPLTLFVDDPVPGPIQFHYETITAEDARPIDWNALEDSIRPDGILNEEWTPMFAAIQARVGATWGNYVQALASMATLLSERGERVHDAAKLFEEIVYQESNIGRSTISGQLTDSVAGLPLAGVSMFARYVEPTWPGPFDANGEVVPFPEDGTVFVARATSGADGRFRFDGLILGEYEVFAEGYDVVSPGMYEVTRRHDVVGATVRATPKPIDTPPSEPASFPSQDHSQTFAVDSAGRVHMVWVRAGTLWHATNNGSAFTDAAPLPAVSPDVREVSLSVSANLIDGTEEGLLATWVAGQEANASDVFYSVGRIWPNGFVQWTEPTRLTNNTVNDEQPALAVDSDGNVLVVWQKFDGAIENDDGDLYSEAFVIANPVFPGPQPAPAPSVSLAGGFGTDFSIPEAIPVIGGDYKYSFTVDGNISTNGSVADGTATLKNKFTIGDYGEMVFAGKFTGQLAKRQVGDNCFWDFAHGSLSAYVDDSLYIPTWNIPIPKSIGTLSAGPVIKFKTGFEAKWDAGQDWSTFPNVNLIQPNFTVGLKALGKGKIFGLDAKLEAIVAGSADIFWDGRNIQATNGKFTVTLNGEVTIPWEFDDTQFYKLKLEPIVYTWPGSAPSAPASPAFNQATLVLVPSSLGTTNDYSDSDGSDVALASGDVRVDGVPALATTSGGDKILAWSRPGEGIATSVFQNSTQSWSPLPAISGTDATANDNVQLAVDNAGRVIAVWSQSNPQLDVPPEEMSSEEIFEMLEQGGDLAYSTFDDVNQTWSVPASLFSRPGVDGEIGLGHDAAGNLVITWLHNDNLTDSSTTLYVSTWSSASGTWSPAQVVQSGKRIDRAASVVVLGGVTNVIWSEDVDPDPNIVTEVLKRSTRSGGIWLAAQNLSITPDDAAASPEANPAGAPSAGNLNTDWIHFGDLDPPDCPEPPPPPPKPKPPKPDPNPPGGGGGSGDGNGQSGIPVDPNDILGPEGFGDERWVAADNPLHYTIRFENVAEATAPAHEVVITQQLDSDLDYRTFRLGDFGFGDLRESLDGRSAFLSHRIDLSATTGFFVDVTATIDVQTGIATWTLRTVDPATGEAPTSAALGFLPPNDANGRGEGFVTYQVRPRANTQTGDRIDAQATIVFDSETPIETPLWTNTIDRAPPTSQVAALPSISSAVFPVAWSATEIGSALSHFDIYVSEDNGPFTLWLANTALTSAPFIGNSNRRYAFYSTATDNAGQSELPPTVPDTTTTTGGGSLAGDFNNDRQVDLRDLIILRNHFGMSSGTTYADGDLNGDTAVNRADAALFVRLFGTSAPAPSPVAHAPSAVLVARDRAFVLETEPTALNSVRVSRADRQIHIRAREGRRVSEGVSSDHLAHDQALASEGGANLRAVRIARRPGHKT
jgi:subtilase family serine protease